MVIVIIAVHACIPSKRVLLYRQGKSESLRLVIVVIAVHACIPSQRVQTRQYRAHKPLVRWLWLSQTRTGEMEWRRREGGERGGRTTVFVLLGNDRAQRAGGGGGSRSYQKCTCTSVPLASEAVLMNQTSNVDVRYHPPPPGKF